jgi:hypothetical protein
MTTPSANQIPSATWRLMLPRDRWQTFLSTRAGSTQPFPWTRRSIVLCNGRARPAPVSAVRA